MSEFDVEQNEEVHVNSGRGYTSAEGTKNQIDAQIAEVIRKATTQVGDGCLDHAPTEDNTAHISKKDTVFYVNTEALAASGNQTAANNIEQQQNSLLISRKDANLAFEKALSNVDDTTRNNALRAMNFIKEEVYYNVYNDYHTQMSNSPDAAKNTIAELRISQAKLALAGQLSNGNFEQRVHEVTNARESAQHCPDNSIVQ